MILLVDTSTKVCYLTLVSETGEHFDYEWSADRELARKLAAYLRDRLAERGRNFKYIKGIGVMKGPGSFTGLRIGLTVLNTIAETLGQPIVGVENAEDWRELAIKRLKAGENDRLVLPYYGREAAITKPRK